MTSDTAAAMESLRDRRPSVRGTVAGSLAGRSRSLSADPGFLSGKVVVVTGAGSGIGRGIAAGFCGEGAHVVGFGRHEDELRSTADQLGQGRMHFVAGDLAHPEDVERLFGQVDRLFGRVDILVNNAAQYPRVRFLDQPLEAWAQVLHVNVIGMAQCCRVALPGMLARGFGRVINVGSFAWRGPIPASSAYSASKAAVSVLTRCIALEIDRSAHPDVLVNELMPGVRRTRMSEQGADPMDVYPYARHLATLPPGGPHGATFDQGHLVVEAQGLRDRARSWLGRLSAGFGH
jgi:NAD(P)-dependent dehydrogenase (short-subunit alcohol dehydrogenase family)